MAEVAQQIAAGVVGVVVGGLVVVVLDRVRRPRHGE